jgi:carbohydrate kinase (thermoresistant glucokinase family)
MGPSGCGKSTLGQSLAAALGWRFVEGDTLHPASNVAKMSAGIPLDDVDRRPFLQRVGEVCASEGAAGVVISCSALKRSHRDLIRSRAGQVSVIFVLPVLDRDTLMMRLMQRKHHFMPAALLDSQLAALEPPGPDERAILIDGAAVTADQARQTLAAISRLESP